MKQSRLLGAVCVCVITFVSLSANTALVPRLGGQAVYDSDLNITWLAENNAAAGSAFDDGVNTSDGSMTFASATTWVENLTVDGFSDWGVDLQRNLFHSRQIFAFCPDPPLPSAIVLNTNCYSCFDGTFFVAIGGSYLGANSQLYGADHDVSLNNNLIGRS